MSEYDKPTLTIATTNKGKIVELRELLSGTKFQLKGLTDHHGILDVSETGITFAENARIKAAGYALQTGTMTLADDSGLEVIALDGRPGVMSARYVGEGTGFDKKIELLLAEIEEASTADRRARFVCSIAVADANGLLLAEVEGVCDGEIAKLPRGTGGFGYDPVFIPEGHSSTFGELSPEIKAKISHRARAISQIIPFLRDFTAN